MMFGQEPADAKMHSRLEAQDWRDILMLTYILTFT